MAMKLFLSASLVLLLFAAPAGSQSSDFCNQLDLVFVLDSSGSIMLVNWGKVLSFVGYIVNNTQVSYYGTRVGVVSFGNAATVNFNLNTYNTTQQVVSAVNQIPFKNENTNTSGALYVMRTVMFTAANGARPNTRKIAIVITDGRSTYDHNLTIPYAVDAKNAGIIIIAIGVGSAIDQTELDGIASMSNNGTPIVYNVDNYAVLGDIQQDISLVACDPPVACNGNFDLVFLLDSSSNVNSDQYLQVKDFVNTIIDNINVADNQSNVALITYSDLATVSFYFDNYHTRADLKTAVDNVAYAPGSGSNLADALRLARESVFVPARGDRPTPPYPSIIIIITNRASSNQSAASEQARLTRLAGVNIMTIAINDWLSTSELYDITSDPVNYNLRILSSYDQLTDAARFIKPAICDLGFSSCSNNPCGLQGICQQTINGYYCKCPSGFAGDNCQLACQPADVVLALDVTSLITSDNFYQFVVTFAKTFAATLNIQPTQTQFAVETFSNSSSVQFYLNQYTTPMDAVNAINPIFTGGYRNTSSALDTMTYNMFSTSQGARSDSNVNRVGVVVTYGGSVNSTQTFASAVQAKDHSITLIVVAVNVVNPSARSELSGIASDPSSANVLYVDQLENLTSVIPTLTSSVCNSINECAVGRCSDGGSCTGSINGYSCECPPGRSGTNCDLACDSRFDLCFLLDSSGSIRETRFPLLLNFTRNLVSRLLIGPDDTQVAVITFSDNATVRFNLSTYQRKGDVLSAIDQIQYTAGRTNTADALRKMTSLMTTTASGARLGVPKFAIIITDGVSTVNEADVLPASIDAKNSGVHIMAVAVMPEGPTPELEGEVSDPSSYNLFSVGNYSDLVTIQNRFLTGFCNDVNECANNPCQNGGTCTNELGKYVCNCGDTYTGVNCERVCTKQVDVVFVLDTSGSVEDAFGCTLSITKLVIQGLNFAGGRTRVGVETFASQATVQFYLNRYTDLSSVFNAIAFFLTSGTTNTPAAFDLMTTGMFSAANGARAGVAKYAITITDGFSNVNAQNTIPKAKSAQQSGITMIGVGISDDEGLNITEVQGISSSPIGMYSFVLNSNSTADIQSTANKILDAICQ